jgi:hypothetical protein
MCKRVLLFCGLAGMAFANVPISLLRVVKAEAGKIEFIVGRSPILAVGVSDVQGRVHWSDFCQQPLESGQSQTIGDSGGQIDTVVTANGVYGTKGLDDLYRRYTAADDVWHKWQDAAKSYSTDTPTFVQQLTQALANTLMPDRTQSEEAFGAFDALTLLKGNVRYIRYIVAQKSEDPRKVILLYLADQVGVFDRCTTIVRAGRMR